MWPFRRKRVTTSIRAHSVIFENGVAEIDVRGQTCPGYLLAINKAVETLDPGTRAKLLITYPPCGEDIKAWCRERKIEFIDIVQHSNMWVIHIQK